MKKSFITLLLAAMAVSLSSLVFAAEKPNLIVIMADDLGYADVGFNGCKDIKTPGIDSIAQQGIRCSSGYVAYPVCSPSRAGFITGRYPQRFGYERNPLFKANDVNTGLALNEKTIADVLGNVGYHCGVIGKWHLGAHKDLHPLKRGFDEFYGHLGGGHFYFPENLTVKNSYSADSYRTWILRNHTSVKPRKYLTDEFSDEAVSFIKRNHEKPFFLFLSYKAPHTPLQATKKYLDRYQHIANKKRRTYAAMVSAVDDGVGRVLDTLRDTKQLQNTIVVFLSDNGGPTPHNASLNTPLRGYKGSPWEGGYRVPFAIQWPATLPAGRVYHQPVSSLDILSTMVALTGARVDKECPLDGVNLIPHLTGKMKGSPHSELYLRKLDQKIFTVRQGDFKLLIQDKNSKPELYNLADDISEKNDIATQHPEKVAELNRLRETWNAELVEPVFLGLRSKRKSGKQRTSQPTPVFQAQVDKVNGHQYTNHREPVVIKTNSGKLIVGQQAGNRHKWPERSGQDLVVKISSNNGKTWGPMIVAAEAGDYSCQCHGLVYDAEKNRVLFLYTTYNWDYKAVGKGRGGKYTAPIYEKMAKAKKPFVTSYMVYSNDEGKTWSKPRDITGNVGRQAHFGASEGRQLTVGKHKGRLLLAGSRMDLGEKGNITHKHLGVWRSDDHGKTWTLSKVPMDKKINTPRNASSEARITELADGTLLYNQRTRKTGRHLSWSKDGGVTWTKTTQAKQLKVTQCNGSLLTLRDKSGKLTNTVLFSVPSPGGRSNGIIYVSKDGGKTWPIAKNVIKGSFAYSALVQLDAKTVGLFYESGGYRNISFVALPLKDLLSK